MAPPSQLVIATSSLNRLVKEEASYHREYEQQQTNISKLEQNQAGGGDGDDVDNAEYQLRQERKALQETKALFPQLRQKIEHALANLEQQLDQNKEFGDQSTAEDLTRAKEAVAAAKMVIRETR